MAYLGLSSAVVAEVGKTVGSWVKNPFNRQFFYWYFFPVLIFIFFHQFAIRPTAFDEHPPSPIEYANRAFPATPTPAPEGATPESEPAPLGEAATPEATPAPSDFQVPEDTGTSGDYFTSLLIGFLGVDLFEYVLIPFVMGVGLNAVAFQITLLYTGRMWPISWLLAPLWAANSAKSKKLYSALPKLRNEYLELFVAAARAKKKEADSPPGADALKPVGQPTAADLRKKAKAMERTIQAKHEEIEKTAPKQTVPVEPSRVAATALGNTLAVAEEYPFQTYGIDSELFWPRLRAELDAETLAPIDSAKSVVDGMLNFSLLAFIATVESIAVIFMIPSELRADIWRVWALIGFAVLGVLIGFGAYRGAVGAASNMGMLMRGYFDYHRDKVLAKFNLKRPDTLEEEKIVWYRLAAFLRRGESFYFPEEAEAE